MELQIAILSANVLCLLYALARRDADKAQVFAASLPLAFIGFMAEYIGMYQNGWMKLLHN